MLKVGWFLENGVKASLDNPQNVKNSQKNAQNHTILSIFILKLSVQCPTL